MTSGLASTIHSRRRSLSACVFCWLRIPNLSARSLVNSGNMSCRFSAVTPMFNAIGSTRPSLTKRGLGAEPDPIGWCPMCSTPPASAMSYIPVPIAPAIMVTLVMAPAHIRSIANPGTEIGSPARIAVERPSVRPWSPF